MTKAGRPPGSKFGEADLMLISGLDRVTAERMILLGLAGLAEMAAWTAADVARWRDRLGLENRISAGNWIEQASLLARGVDTAYAARVRRGETACLVMRPLEEPLRRRLQVAVPETTAPTTAGGSATAPPRGSLMRRLGRAAHMRPAQPPRLASRLGPVEEATVEIVRRNPGVETDDK